VNYKRALKGDKLRGTHKGTLIQNETNYSGLI